MEIHEKHFKEWMGVKEKLHNRTRVPNITVGEIWWCGVGENVGTEIDGKDDIFARPVLVLSKISRLGFIGIPLTSKIHNSAWYGRLFFRDKFVCAALSQVRYFSVSRLYNRMGIINDEDLSNIKEGLLRLLFP